MAANTSGWSSPADLRTAVLRAWTSGELLREFHTPSGTHPRRRTLKYPSATQLRTDYARAAAWAQTWDPAPRGAALEYISVGATTIGANTLPCAAVFASAAEEITFLGFGREAAKFTELSRHLTLLDIRLEAWSLQRPLELLKFGVDALTAARVALWMEANPAPGLYLRQLSLPGVHTKFVENHRRLIDSMLAVLVPERLLSGKNYARRHGFLAAPDRVRLRFLDPTQVVAQGMEDIEVTAAAFAGHPVDVDTIITTENLVNFLALPQMPRTLAVFGGGYGFEGIRDAAWLADVEVLYWGDIDTHGFRILDQLRSHHPHVRSILMDEETLLAHRDFWGHEGTATSAQLTHLNPAENALHYALMDGTFAPTLRLEQELLRWDWVLGHLL
ncbi:Wadjet anti-phage system protein JetD domain-containing protein [Arthrobacter sp. lap29]|uniref:Wadjet anti-phage system protein JetD domain-containing protein n=1 Tax=Arthrobacter sp. lap29 TaxID=3056122 RepID=UPI0028F6D6C8|nr:Wadjet anti-phage system protein JetD domain-containing protein [Arthrobacter sp. lap29]